MRTSLLVAAAGLLAALTWQTLVVHYLYAGNWTGLYCTGGLFQQRPPLAEPIRTFPDSYGYDGQWYHYMAHDPWFRRGFDRFLDAPRLRYRRILLPALANLLAGGKDRYVDRMYISLMLLSIFLGALWLSWYARLQGLSPWLGLGFVIAPSVLISIDRLTLDGVLAAACAGFLWFVESNPGWPLYTLLVAAPLIRETGFVLTGAYVAALVLQRMFGRAAVFTTTIFPAAAWYWVVASHTEPYTREWHLELPLAGYLHQLFHPNSYPLAAPMATVATVLDYISLAGVGLALIWALFLLRRKTFTPAAIAIYAFAAGAALLPTGDVWYDPNAYTRYLTPLVLLLAAESWRDRRRAMAFPMLMMTPRIAFQLGGIALGVAKAMLG